METRQLYASVTATGQVYFDAPRNARIKGVTFCATSVTASATGDTLNLEISTTSTNQTLVQDAVNIVAVAAFDSPGSAGTREVMSFYCPSDVAIKAGDRIYLNYTEAGAATWNVRALVFLA